jgi:two-component system sensor histidine kinase TctE
VSIRSLRLRVAAYLLIPMAALALALAAGGTWFVDAFVTRAYDRVLAGSILSIAERLSVQDGHVTVDMPAAAFRMLSNSERDSIFYSVSADGEFVTGYKDLGLPATLPPVETLAYRDGVFLGQRVRIGAMLKPIYVTNHTALVQVAETTHGRDLLVRRMLTALTVLGSALAAIGVLLVWFAVQMGLTPLDRLRREVEQRRFNGRGAVPPFTVAGVPGEALPLVGALNELLRQLNHALTVMREFTTDASHQLRTPVAILKTHLSLLDRQPPGSAAWNTSRADIAAAVDRLDHLIAQLLTLAAVEEGAARRPEPVTIDLARLARDATADFAGLALRRDIDLSFEALSHPSIRLEPLLLEEILRNLIDNAVRYTGPGGQVAVSVASAAGEDGGAVRIAVEDNGPGIPEAERERVFERFHRLDANRDTEGSGLGLAIVRAYSDQLRARVTLACGRDGRGLRAEILLSPESRPTAGSPLREVAARNQDEACA